MKITEGNVPVAEESQQYKHLERLVTFKFETGPSVAIVSSASTPSLDFHSLNFL
jgi:hypothetical protein